MGVAAQRQQEITFNADQQCWSAKAMLTKAQRRVDAATANEAH
jgi:hypothetical protein